MEDINAKRDARRRRILENSEGRLLKITGRNSNTESEDISSLKPLLIGRDVQKGTTQSNINGTTADICSDRVRNAGTGKSDNDWYDISTSSRCKYDGARTEIENVYGNSARTRLLPLFLLTNRLNYVFLAVIVNILLALELDHLFGKTIAIPCLVMMLGRLYSCQNTRETRDSSLLYTALMLCNIKPELTYRLKSFVTLFHMILGDLALYIFSFTLMHYVLSYCYLRDTDIVTTFDE